MTLLDEPHRTTHLDTGWAGFVGGPWQHGIDVRDFIQRSYAPFMGDASFPTVSRIEVLPFHQMGEDK